MAVCTIRWLSCSLFVLYLSTEEGNADCELCKTVEPYTDTAEFLIDGVNADDWTVLFPFVRMNVESEKERFEGSKQLILTVNGRLQSYQGCYSYPRNKIVKYLDKVTVTWMSRAMNLSESDRCTGKDQTSVRIAQLAEGMEVFATRNESMSVEISVDGPSSVSEVCVGYEGGSCNMTGQGHSYRRCFANPSMSDGCALRMIEEHNCTVITSGMGTLNLSDHSVQLSDFDQVYVSYLRKHVEITVKNITDQSMVEVMNNEDHSTERVILVDAGESNVHMIGADSQTGNIIASGNTSLTCFLYNRGEKNRVEVNARCADKLELWTAMVDSSPLISQTRWSLRVGCPNGIDSMRCRIKDLVTNSNLKMIFVASKESWNSDTISLDAPQTLGGYRRRSMGNAFVAYYTTENEECCLSDMCDFKKKCKVIETTDGRLTSNKLCNSFVLSIHSPIIHIIIAGVFLLTIFSLLLWLISDDSNIQDLKHIKMIIQCMCYSIGYCLWWLSLLIYQSVFIYDDIFEHTVNGRSFYLSLLMGATIWPIHGIAASDIRWLHYELIEELMMMDIRINIDSMDDDNHDYSHWNLSNNKNDDLTRRVHRSFVILFAIASVISIVLEYEGLLFVIIFFSLIWFNLACIMDCYRQRPNIGLIWFWMYFWVMIAESLSFDVSVGLGLFLWHFWDFTLLWALIFELTMHERINKRKETKNTTMRMKILINVMKWMIQIVKLYAKIFDSMSDYVLIVFFFANHEYFFAIMQLTFVFSAIVVSLYYEWDSVDSWVSKAALITGFGQIIEIIEPGINHESVTFLNECELHLESLPSLFLGMLILLTSPREDTGPILFSMGVTWFVLALKAFSTVTDMDDESSKLKKASVFVILLSDFFIRCVSPSLIVAIIQGQSGENAKWGSILFFVLYSLLIFLSYLCFYHRTYSSQSSRLYLRALVSLVSCRSAVMAYLRMDHYQNDPIILESADLYALTIPHCVISTLFSCVAVILLWDVYSSLILTTLLFSLMQVCCVYGLSRSTQERKDQDEREQGKGEDNPETKKLTQSDQDAKLMVQVEED